MGVTVDRKQLVSAIGKVRPAAAASRGALPALRCVRLTSEANRLRITATDLDHRLEVAMRAEGAADVLVDPKSLLRILRSSKELVVSIDDRGTDGVAVRLNGSTVTLPAVSADDWPSEPTWDEGEVVPIPPHLAEAIVRVAAAASPEDSRPILTGVCFDGTTIAATDSYRLAWMGPFQPMPTMLVPAGPLASAMKSCGDNLAMIVADSAVMVCGTAGSAVMRRIKGEFPKWRELVPPKNEGNPIVIDRSAAVEALRRCEAFVDSQAPAVRLAIKGDRLLLTAESGAASFSDSCPLVSGTLDHRLALNPTYLREGLESLRGDTATLRPRDELKPMLMPDGDFGYLLMPVRIP